MPNPFLFVFALAAAQVDTVGPDDLAHAYVEVVDVYRYGQSSASPIVARLKDEGSLPDDHLLRGFLEENGSVFVYLLQNVSSLDPAALLAGAGTLEEKTARYHAALLADTSFRAVADPLVAAFLAREGHVIDESIPTARRAIAIEQLQRVAVRFFYPDTMAPGGQFGGHICVGKNGNADHPARDLLLEAVAFSALMDELRRSPQELSARFRAALSAAEALDLSSDVETALARAQGVVWHALQDDPLIRSLLEAYLAERASWFPVTVT